MLRKILTTLTFAATMFAAPIALSQDNQGSVGADTPFEVNINTADAEELDKYLDGVGKSKAQAIVDFREEFGQFESLDSLKNVKGIGSGIIDKNKDRIVL
ncbi:ComEA family DNA-binding protein [Enterovibrio baiacu]|uniref:ComEA family DNA-binding protein n=1 Tax=Enterovibrio baiacu TaxID=2491023 RepID=UPI001010D2D7|nr:ComEA family DNA-binding protein [Enterovibrio baiacu]MBE1274817.1 ComEA family DNA-binding protein [Enterovibrio baiacu]